MAALYRRGEGRVADVEGTLRGLEKDECTEGEGPPSPAAAVAMRSAVAVCTQAFAFRHRNGGLLKPHEATFAIFASWMRWSGKRQDEADEYNEKNRTVTVLTKHKNR